METLGGFALHSAPATRPASPSLRSASPNLRHHHPPCHPSLRSASRDGPRRAKLGGSPRVWLARASFIDQRGS
jgi:hypothetical protein